MTAQELLSSLSGSLMDDDRILNARERELLASLLQHVSPLGTRENAVTETIARAVGEVIAKRAYGVLGSQITQRLLDSSTAETYYPLRAHGPHPPSPSPPGPGAPATGPRPGGPRPGGPRPGDLPGGPRDLPLGPRPEQSGPRASLADPHLRDTSVPGAVQSATDVAVLEAPGENLPAHYVVLDEFLAPAELDALMAFTLANEAAFQLSEVISPEIGGGVDFEYRRSRVLQDLGPHREVLLNRVQNFLPRILEELDREAFPVTRIEAQVTASNDGDFFRWHSDNGQGEIATREITFVYFFHHEPRQFSGGELRLYDSHWENGGYRPGATYHTIAPQQNQIVCFLSSLAHEITPVECPSRAFADSRFTLNGWLHR